MASVNMVALAGNLTKDPELRFTQDGVPVASFTLAVGRRGSEKTDYFGVTCWRGLAEGAANYLGKGSAAIVSGELHHQSWEGEDGQKRSRHVIQAQSVQFVDSAGQGMNRAIFAGNLTRTPEIKHVVTGDGEEVAVASFGLAVNRTRGKAAKEGVADFIEVACWRQLGEIVAEYKHKGDGVLVEGALRYDQWENGEGRIRSRITLTADSVQFTTMAEEAAPDEDFDDEEDFEDVVVDEPEAPKTRTNKARQSKAPARSRGRSRRYSRAA
jgi:single-strand DNA-binding protein